MLKSSNSFSDKWKFCLMNKDKEILIFSIFNDLGDYVIREEKRLTDKLPIGFTNIEDWVSDRRAPKHREYIETLLEL